MSTQANEQPERPERPERSIRTRASSTPICENKSIEPMNDSAIATMPNSAGASRRTRTSVLARPMMRVAMRQANTQAKPCAARAISERAAWASA